MVDKSKNIPDDMFEDVPYQEQSIPDDMFEDVQYNESPSSSSDPSYLGGTAFKALQGALMGFADEAGGGIGAVGQALTDKDKSLSDVPELYTNIRDQIRNYEKTFDAENPGTAIAAELLGGVAPALFTGGASALANIGKVGLGQSIKAGAKSGLIQGAASGLGYSEGESLDDVGKDVALGGLAGGAIGGAVPAISRAIKGVTSKPKAGIKDWLTDQFESVDTMLDSKARSAAGQSNIGQKARTEIVESMQDDIKNWASYLENSRKKLGQEFQDIYSQADNLGLNKDIKNITNSIIDDINDATKRHGGVDFTKDMKDLTSVIKATDNFDNLSVKQLQSKANDIYQVASKFINTRGDKASYGQAIDAYKKIQKSIEDLMSKEPNLARRYSKVKKQFSDLKDSIKIIDKKFDPNTPVDKINVENKVFGLIGRLEDDGLSSDRARRIVEESFDRLKSLDDIETTTAMRDALFDKAKRYDINTQARRSGVNVIGSLENVAARAGAATGATQRGVNKVMSIPAQKFIEAGEMIAQIIPGKTGENARNQLAKAASDNSLQRAAAIHTLMQNPATREYVKDMFPELKFGDDSE